MLLLSAKDVGAQLSIHPAKILRMAEAGALPPPIFVAGLARWRAADISAWVAAGCPTCEPMSDRDYSALICLVRIDELRMPETENEITEGVHE